MIYDLKINLLKVVDFTEIELLTIISMMEEKCIKKHSFLLNEGNACNDVAFINKGAFRIFFTKDGEEHVDGFFPTGAWVADYRAFLCRTKSVMNIEALEDSEVFQLGYDKMQKLYTLGTKFERLGRLIAEKLFVAISQRNSSLILETPEDRYRNLITNQPHLLEMVPLKQIASYIGVRPESLSRIRKRISC